MAAAIKDEVKAVAETIWPEYEITVGPVEGNPQVGGVPPDVTKYAVDVRDRDGQFVDRVTADTMEELRELIEQKLNRG
jgi:hypothetical protein